MFEPCDDRVQHGAAGMAMLAVMRAASMPTRDPVLGLQWRVMAATDAACAGCHWAVAGRREG